MPLHATFLSAAEEAKKGFQQFQQGIATLNPWQELRNRVDQLFPQVEKLGQTITPQIKQSSQAVWNSLRQKVDKVLPNIVNQPLFQLPGVGVKFEIPSPTVGQAYRTFVKEGSPIDVTLKGQLGKIPGALKTSLVEGTKPLQLRTPEDVRAVLLGSIGIPTKTLGKKPIDLLRKSIKPTAEQVSQAESQLLREAQAEMRASAGSSPYQSTFTKMRNFLRLAGEKRSKETGELFREHIPRSVFGQSSDELASSMGMTENELMAKMTEGLNVGQGLRTSRGFTNVRSIDNPLALGKDWQIRKNIDQGKKFVSEMLEERRIFKDTRKLTEPLDDLVNKTPIDVKKKVNILDYLRTPNRVLEKIGLGEEAKLLRTKYDDYLQELPKEIDRITAWSKRVHPTSNQRIFQWLDGDKIKLNNEELKVANEIKSYLKEWATKLKLPEDKQISNYITHIFEKGKITKEFDPELAKLIQGKVVKSVYDPFLQRRMGMPEYKQDTWQALEAYVKRGTRKLHMDQALEKVATKAENLPLESYNYVKGRIARINMQPTDIDNLIDNLVKSSPIGYRLGQRPTTAVTQTARQMVFRGLLGLNPGTALRNLQQSTNSYAVLGEKNFGIGLMKTIQNLPKLVLGRDTELEQAGILGKDIVQDRTFNAVKKFWENADNVLFYKFNLAEKLNRGIAYWGGKAQALDKGMNEQQAFEHAKNIVGKAQFYYDVIDTPAVLQSDLAKTLFQFAKYPLAQTEFLVEMVKNKNVAGSLRWIASNLLFIATAGKILGLDYGDMFPDFSRFAPGRFAPPTLQFPIETGKAALNVPKEYGQVSDEENLFKRIIESKDVQRGLLNYLPGGGQLRKTFEAGQAIQEGGSFTPSGKLRFTAPESLSEKAQSLLFGIWSTPEAKTYLDNLQGKNLSSEEQSAQEFKKQEKEVEDSETKLAGKMYLELQKLTPEERYSVLEQWETDGRLTPAIVDKLEAFSKSKAQEKDSAFIRAIRMAASTNSGKAKFINIYLKNRTSDERYELLQQLDDAGILTDDLIKKLEAEMQ